MTIAFEGAGVILHNGDCIEVMRTMPDASVDAVVTDPPYGLEFMGNKWDGWATLEDFERWCAEWAAEALRLLKPGGHIVAFGGSRTWHRLAAGIEDAGFEIRDSIAWLYGSGFPKSLDVSNAMERFLTEGPAQTAAGEPNLDSAIYQVTAFLRGARTAAGWTNKQLDELFGTNGMAGHWTTSASQPQVPSVAQWAVLKEKLGFGDDMDNLVAELGAIERPEGWGEGTESDPNKRFLGTLGEDYESAGAWGTALKPAFEPIVVGRKPIVGTVAGTVKMYGTGALHIGASRTGDEVRVLKGQTERSERTASIGAFAGGTEDKAVAGRWPTNVLLDSTQAPELGESGKYFPTFHYESKAPTSERPNVDGLMHPTVKPLDLMRWLCRLVTPVGGVILEPFAGSGTTLEAALREGFDVIGIEREVKYLPLIEQRITKPLQVSLFGDWGEVA